MFLLDFVEIPIVYLQPINTVIIYLITLIKAFLGNQKSMNQLPDPEKFVMLCSLVMPEVLAVFSYPSSCQYASCFDSAALLDAHFHQQLKIQVGKLYKIRTIRQYCLASCSICKTTPTGIYF